MQGDRGGEHFREHGVVREYGFAVHEGEEVAGEAGGGADGGTAGREGGGGVVARDVGGEEPGCVLGVEEGVEGDEVGFFSDTPFISVFFVGGGGSGCGLVLEDVVGGEGPPY